MTKYWFSTAIPNTISTRSAALNGWRSNLSVLCAEKVSKKKSKTLLNRIQCRDMQPGIDVLLMKTNRCKEFQQAPFYKILHRECTSINDKSTEKTKKEDCTLVHLLSLGTRLKPMPNPTTAACFQ